jgi:predicted ester cyclase
MTVTSALAPSEIYDKFLTALNSGDHDALRSVIAPDFTDHHPGFDIAGIDSYLAAVTDAKASLQLTGSLLSLISKDELVVTRVLLTGKHVGEVFGIASTGKQVSWETIEIWRVSDGQLAERWAQDDLSGLRQQLSAAEDNLALVRKVSNAVNSRRYDDLDALFAPDFVDRNAAWTVTSLAELKGIIIAAHEGLDFVANTDALYPAGEDRVVMHITFTGRHIGEFFGRPPTGRPVVWTSIEVYRLVDGKVAERWVQADTAGLMGQVGVSLPQ